MMEDHIFGPTKCQPILKLPDSVDQKNSMTQNSARGGWR